MPFNFAAKDLYRYVNGERRKKVEENPTNYFRTGITSPRPFAYTYAEQPAIPQLGTEVPQYLRPSTTYETGPYGYPMEVPYTPPTIIPPTPMAGTPTPVPVSPTPPTSPRYATPATWGTMSPEETRMRLGMRVGTELMTPEQKARSEAFLARKPGLEAPVAVRKAYEAGQAKLAQEAREQAAQVRQRELAEMEFITRPTIEAGGRIEAAGVTAEATKAAAVTAAAERRYATDKEFEEAKLDRESRDRIAKTQSETARLVGFAGVKTPEQQGAIERIQGLQSTLTTIVRSMGDPNITIEQIPFLGELSRTLNKQIEEEQTKLKGTGYGATAPTAPPVTAELPSYERAQVGQEYLAPDGTIRRKQ